MDKLRKAAKLAELVGEYPVIKDCIGALDTFFRVEEFGIVEIDTDRVLSSPALLDTERPEGDVRPLLLVQLMQVPNCIFVASIFAPWAQIIPYDGRGERYDKHPHLAEKDRMFCKLCVDQGSPELWRDTEIIGATRYTIFGETETGAAQVMFLSDGYYNPENFWQFVQGEIPVKELVLKDHRYYDLAAPRKIETTLVSSSGL